jgi:cytochrome c peroxidase
MLTFPAQPSQFARWWFRFFAKGAAHLRQTKHAALVGLLVPVAVLLVIVTGSGQQLTSVPNRTFFPNPSGASETYSTTGGGIDLTGPFFQSLGSNGRSCATCHQLADGMSVAAAHIQQRFDLTEGLDPIFRTNDGSNCNHSIDVSTLAGRSAAYSLLRTRGLIRVAIPVPANADYQISSVSNPYGCNESDMISMYRRPLPATNLRFLSTVMFDGRESSPATGTTKISYLNYPESLTDDLKHQSLDATIGHAQGDGSRPTAAEQQQIVDFEMALATAQIIDNYAGRLDVHGAKGGPTNLTPQPFFISINSSIRFLLQPPLFNYEAPGGLVKPGDGEFRPAIFDSFDAWASMPEPSPRAAVARGQAIFNSKPIHITGVAGINDEVSAGGLLAGGMPSLTGTCGTCHDTPNVGNHSFPTPLDIGTGDPDPANASVNLGGLDVSYLPSIMVCKLDLNTNPPSPTNTCKTTTDLGQALIDGRFDHVGKIKGPILRGLAARAPYFHNGSARTLVDVVHFYESRFGLVLTPQEEADLAAFLGVL